MFRADKVMRDLVYKAVPGLFQSEQQKLIKFNTEHRKEETSSSANSHDSDDMLLCTDYYSPDEPIR